MRRVSSIAIHHSLKRLPSTTPITPISCISTPPRTTTCTRTQLCARVAYASPYVFHSYTTATSQAAKSPPQDSTPPPTAKNTSNYTFATGMCSIPHPTKVKKGGEDAHFISSDGKVFGVADGVGGWGEVGIDPALYSRSLMEGSRLKCEEDLKNEGQTHDPRKIMFAGWQHASKVIGSSTCCICVLDGLKLKVANLGDSGFTIVRGGKVVFSSEPQQHAFNFPYQLGPESTDKPGVSELFEKNVEVGDVIIAATDGVYDNISPDTIATVVGSNPTASAKQIAENVGKHARSYADKTTGSTPFAISALKHGYAYAGGKLDDITVVVGIVTEPGK